MKQETKMRLRRSLRLALIAAALGAAIGFIQLYMQASPSSEQGQSGSLAIMPRVGGEFTALDQDAALITQDIFQDHYSLVYFGFTYCPAICPTELQKMTAALQKLEKHAPDKAKQLQPFFVSIDPERDTPETVKSYISLFHPKFSGITGNPEQIAHLKKLYHVFAEKVWDEEAGKNSDDYTMDHSSYIYLLNPEGRLLAIYRMKDDADKIFKDLEQKIANL